MCVAGVQQDLDLVAFQEGDHGTLYGLGAHHPMPVRRLLAICSPCFAHCGSSGSDRPEFPEEWRSDFPEPAPLGGALDQSVIVIAAGRSVARLVGNERRALLHAPQDHHYSFLVAVALVEA